MRKLILPNVSANADENDNEVVFNFDDEDLFIEFLSIILTPLNSLDKTLVDYAQIEETTATEVVKDFFFTRIKMRNSLNNAFLNLMNANPEQLKE